MNYLLDTCVVSDFVKGETGTLARLKAVAPSQIYFSSISLMEIRYGLGLSPQKAKKIEPILNDFFSVIGILNFGQGEAEISAQIRWQLRQQGNPIGAYDVLIAGTALAHNLIMVTANENEFVRVQDLVVENWRQQE